MNRRKPALPAGGVGSGFRDTRPRLLGGSTGGGRISAAGGAEPFVTEFLESPCAVFGDDAGGAGGGECGAVASGVVGAEGWLERAVETFAAAVGRGLADEREAGREAGEAALARAGVGAVAPAVSVAQFTAAGRADGPGPKACVIARATCLSFAKRSPRWPTGWPRPSALPARWSRTATAGRRRGSALSRHRCPAHRGRGGDDAAIVRLGWRGCHAVR